MLILSLILVWVIINTLTNMRRMALHSQVENQKMYDPRYNINLSMRRHNVCVRKSDPDIVTNIKNQILKLYDSDMNKTGAHINTIVQLLNNLRMYEDTTELLDNNPQILRYIFNRAS